MDSCPGRVLGKGGGLQATGLGDSRQAGLTEDRGELQKQL